MSTTEFNLTIATPGDWIVIDTEALADPDNVDVLIDDRLDVVPELAGRREDLVDSVSRTMARSREEGVIFTAMLADVGEQGEVLMANLAVGTSAAPPPVPDAAPTDEQAASPAESPAALDPSDLGPAFAEAEPGVDRREVDSVLLPGGPAVRVARLFDVPLADDGPLLTVLSVQYFFPVPDRDQMLVVSFTTPSVGAAQHLQRIFHGIAETVAFD